LRNSATENDRGLAGNESPRGLCFIAKGSGTMELTTDKEGAKRRYILYMHVVCVGFKASSTREEEETAESSSNNNNNNNNNNNERRSRRSRRRSKAQQTSGQQDRQSIIELIAQYRTA
jgi:hypothetical protein